MHQQHVFAWIAGFGWTLMPFAPFRFERVPGLARAIQVERATESGLRRGQVIVDQDGRQARFESETGGESGVGGSHEPNEVVELMAGAAFAHWEHGAAHDDWRIETSVLSVGWPRGFAMRSTPDAPPPFELVGPDGALIWLQGPLPTERLPPLEQMVGPGQRIVQIAGTAGGPSVELRYEHDGRPWRMVHCVVDRFPGAACVVSGQAPESRQDLLRAAVIEVAATLVPCRPG